MGMVVTLRGLREERYGRIVCYPRYDSKELEMRLGEMRRMGIRALEFMGGKNVFEVPVLGKGCVGIVVLAQTDLGRVALKIRRVDADRDSMRREAEMLKLANSVGAGPRLLGFTENLLMMQFIDGALLPMWIKSIGRAEAASRIRRILRSVLEQSWMLDKLGLDHGELSRAPKHIILNDEDEPYILDFETASIVRRASNVTSICQYLFIKSEISRAITEKLDEINAEELITVLRIYKRNPTRENFERIIEVCKL